MYPQKVFGKIQSAAPAALALTSAANTYFGYSDLILTQHKVSRLGVLVSVAAGGTVAGVVSFYARPQYNNSGSQVLLGTITIPVTATVGQVYYKNIDGYAVAPGMEVIARLTTPISGVGAAGSGYAFYEGDDSPEVPANQSNMVAG